MLRDATERERLVILRGLAVYPGRPFNVLALPIGITAFTPGSTSEMTKGDETAFFLQRDSDGNGVGDGQDCGTAVAGNTTTPVRAANRTLAKRQAARKKIK